MIIGNRDPRVDAILKEADVASFVAYSTENVSINDDADNPSFFTDLILAFSNKIELIPELGAIRSLATEVIPFMEGTLNFQPEKTGGGVSNIHLVSERSFDGQNWVGNLSSLRSIEVSNSGETYKTVYSAIVGLMPGEMCRFRAYNAAGANIDFEAPVDNIIQQDFIGYPLLWSLTQKNKLK